MRLIITFLFLLGSSAVFGQLKQKAADGFFDDMEYSRCVQMYDELADKAIEGSKKGNWENVHRAAASHYHLFEMDKAVVYYEALASKNKLNEDDRVKYIQALRYEGKYGKSSELIRESHHLFPGNPFFSLSYSHIDDLNELYMDSTLYKVNPAENINSGKGDFSPAFFNNSLVYVSKAKNTRALNSKYGWDDDFYLNILQAEFTPDSTLEEPHLLKNNFLSSAHDGPVSFNADGTEMVITKNTLEKRKGQHVIVLALYFSKLVNGEWTELEPFEFNNRDYNVGHGSFSQDGKKLYFVSDKPGGQGESDIYVCERQGESWTEPKNLGPEINSDQNELFPYEHDNLLYFASDGHFGLGGLDIFSVKLGGTDVPDNLGAPVCSSGDDFGIIFNKQGNIGYFSSNRGDYKDRIYRVKRSIFDIQLEGAVFEQYAELEAVPNQKLWVRNMTTQKTDSLMTDDKGNFSKKLRMDQDYRVYTSKDEYILLKEESASTKGIRRDSTIHRDLVLKPTTIIVHLRVIEKESRKVVPNATTIITDYNKDWDTTLITNEEGLVTLTVDRNIVLWAHASKRGFIDADVSFNTTNKTDRIIDLELELPPIKKGEKFKLENIFYDLNKSTLRPESKSSLDKLAKFIIDNDLKIELSAHTDSRGSSSYNQRLSQARAQSCVDYLIKNGVKPYNIKAKGYGETRLVNRCKDGVKCSEEEHQENRRTEVKILEIN